MADPAPGRGARHIALPQVGRDGQAAIGAGKVLVIGVGGIGCAAASYLASSGVGHIVLCDFDTVDATNLGRQILYGPDDVGQLKADRAAAALSRINPDVELTVVADRMRDEELATAVVASDAVLDATDNFGSRFQINAACVAAGRRLISGSAIRFEAQLAVFGPKFDKSPCYRCLYSDADESMDDCAGNGVLAPVPGMIGTMMASEALKFLANIDSPIGTLSLYDGLSGDWRSLTIPKRADCPVCGDG